jgi:2-keto-3-deoxy-L-rhamnonate aldolase RhmA
MDNLEVILSTPGLEMVILGELDLALRLGGVEGERARERVEEYRRETYRIAGEADVSVIDIVATRDEAREAVERGADGLLYGQDDLAMLRDVSQDRVEALRSGTE